MLDRASEHRPGHVIRKDGTVMKDRPGEDGVAVLVNKKRSLRLKIVHSNQILTGPQRIVQLVTCQDEFNRCINIVDTRLSFPSHSRLVINEEKQLHEIMKITQALTNADTYEQHQQPRLEIIGDDFNSDSQSLAARCLKSNPCNFVNCASAEQSLTSGLGRRSNLVVTHRSHRVEDVSVDHVFTRLVCNNEDEADEKSLSNKASALSKSSSSLNGVESVSSTAHLKLGHLNDKDTRTMD